MADGVSISADIRTSVRLRAVELLADRQHENDSPMYAFSKDEGNVTRGPKGNGVEGWEG